MADDSVPMTVEGKKALEEELKNLLTVERPTVVRAIEHARSLGDLGENADYSAAKERQSFIEGRIMEINSKLARSRVIDVRAIKADKVLFGATVEISDQESGKPSTYKIVGVDEADIKLNKISINSPLARALIGKKIGDEVVFNAPKGTVRYDIVEFRYE
jgi:transcription elongation factor GreA